MIMLFGAQSLWFRFKCRLVSDIELKPHTVRDGEDVQDPTIVEFKIYMAIKKYTINGVPDQETGFVGKSQTN